MHNLVLQRCDSFCTSLNDVQRILVDYKKDIPVYYYTTKTSLYAFDKGSGLKKKLIERKSIVHAEILSLNHTICLALEEGEVIVISLDTNEVSECTYCDVGIENMCWSPDQEVAVFITKHHHVVLMTCDFEIITDYSLYDRVESNFVSVGWGRKETQFNGNKANLAYTEHCSIDQENINELPLTTHITWRGDATYFAVSYLNPGIGRVFKVFNKEGQLCFISESERYLRPIFAWRPSGNWIAMPQYLPNKSIIALFEKNGLKHREITLPFSLKQEEVHKISWSSDSDILTIETFRKESDENRLYFYTISNYHWYLKQVLIFNACEDGLVTHGWDDSCSQSKTLHILLKSGKHLIYSWEMMVNKIQSLVGVIDGKKLLLTNFTQNIVPPPMYQYELVLENDSLINDVGFNDKVMFVLDAHKNIHIYCIDLENELSICHKATLNPPANILQLFPIRNICWLTEKTMIAVNVQGELVFITLNDKNKCYSCNSYSMGNKVMQISNILSEVYVNIADGNIYHIKFNVDNTIEWFKQESISPLSKCALYIVMSPMNELIIWQSNLCLLIDSEQIASDVTSFCVLGELLIYTQLSLLCFMKIKDRKIVSKRKIESGAKIITTVSKEGRIIMQMPRGNLEVITPRILVLQYIGKLLNSRQYNEAFTLARKYRINLNILCDHNLCDFMQNIDIFLNEINNTQWLNIFLMDLQNKDFAKTMYAENYEADERVYPIDVKISEKVNYLCKKMCGRMMARNKEHFWFSILTAYVKMGEVETALTIIWQQIQQDEERTKTNSKSNEAEKSLRYLFYLVDVNELYNVALGTYDFRLVLFVAQHSQKDPREFLLTLNELNCLDNNYRCFRIDKYLKRNERALKHIIRCDQAYFNEALEFIKENSLFGLALENYSELKITNNYEQVALEYADFLRANGKLYDASLMYERGGNLKQSQLCARHILDWERVLFLAKKLNQDVSQEAQSLVMALQEQGKFDVCYQLTITYSGNVPEALKFLLLGKLYLKAIFSARLLDAFQFIEDEVAPSLLSYICLLTTNLNDEQELFSTLKTRLLVLKEQQKPMLMHEKETSKQIDEIDLISDTTSLYSSKYTNTSHSTSKFSRSSKGRRKHDRKLLSLKPGNPFEEIALIDALYGLVLKMADIKQQEHIRDTCKALLELKLDNTARDLQKCYKSGLHLVETSLKEIWKTELTNGAHLKSAELGLNCWNTKNYHLYSMLDPIKLIAPVIRIIDWEQSVLN